jgi:hypothetical protein
VPPFFALIVRVVGQDQSDKNKRRRGQMNNQPMDIRCFGN